MINVTLNGQKIRTNPGKTVLELAKEHGIEIPTLCHDEELQPFGSCWVCAVQVKGRRGFVTACGTEISNGMEIITDSKEIFKARKMALELLLSDHYADCEAPCKTACPDNVDVQSYVALIANNQPHEAVKVLKDTLPMPLSIGRVCPAFCEQECRRQLVEEPIAIRQLKRYAADEDLNDAWSYVPPKEEDKSEKIAVIGAGPSGLTCGFYLSQKGYQVTVFEAAPEPGGWLRYGIPEYRLPKELLKKEIDLMCQNGMEIITGKQLGKDFTLSQLSEKYDAVYLALGAQNGVPMRVKGNDLPGCYLGVDYLKSFMMGEEIKTGKKVAVVGGGNTAIDCARTAKRLGADVTIVYRRTRKEMPAEAYEVDAAEEEGVKFHFLTNPVEYKGDENGINDIVLEKMKLGEPDSSGRRRPEPTGEFFTEPYDTVIAAISQIPEVELFAEEGNKIDGKTLPLSRWSTADVSEDLLYTGLDNVFAGGDFRLGPATAIEAIADGRKAADNIHLFLEKGSISEQDLSQKQFCSVKAEKIKEISDTFYKIYPQENREKMPELDPKVRSANFEEVELGYPEEQAKKEADRCLECGCLVNTCCDLRDQATEYGVDNSLFFGQTNQHPIDDSHPFILRDANKCIKCGRCVRICSELQGAGVLGYIFRGFTTIVAPEFGESLTKTTCESCGKCITVCPVGALVEKNTTMKRFPLEDEKVSQNCGNCGSGCKVDIHMSAGKPFYITPAEEEGFNKRNICFYGRFGYQAFTGEEAIETPLLRNEQGWETISWEKASEIIREKKKQLHDVSVSVSPHATNEEITLMHEVANNNNTIVKSLTFRKIFTDDLLERHSNSCDFSDIGRTDNIVIIGEISQTLRTICRHYQRKGKRLAIFSREDNRFNHFADCLCREDDLVEALKRIKDNHIFNGDEEKSLHLTAKTIFIYNRNELSEEEIYHLWDLASLICSFSKGSGILETSHWNNLKGFRKLASYEPVQDEGLIISYGELPEVFSEADKQDRFIVAALSHKPADCEADLILPKPSYLEIEGTTYSDDGSLCKYHNPLQSIKFDLLLQLFNRAGMISDIQVEPNLWLNKAEQLLADIGRPLIFKRMEVAAFMESVKPIGKIPLKPSVPHWAPMHELKNLCHE